MKIIRFTIVRLALIVLVGSGAGCTFRPFVELRDPARAAVAPCYSGDVCAMDFDGATFAWTTDVMKSARR